MAFNTEINTSLLTTYLIKKFIPTLEAELQFQKFTTPAVIPPGEGKIGRFNVFSNPPGTTSALTEGTTTGNEITTLTTTGTDCTIAEYGEFIKCTSLERIAAVKGTRDELAKRMAYGGALALDTLVRAQAAATTVDRSAQDASPFIDSDGTTKPTACGAAPVMGATKVLRDISNTTAKGFTGVKGHPEGAFAGIFSPLAEMDMTTEATTGRITWKDAVVNVPGLDGQKRWVKGYMGEVYGTACYRTQNYQQVTITSLSDANYILAEGGIGAVSFDDMKADIIINDVNSPYKNVDSIAWHAFFGTKLIDANRVVKLYTLAA